MAKSSARIREHVHGVLASSLLVTAFFLATTVPVALYLVITGQAAGNAWIYPMISLVLLGLGLREARSWQRALTAPSP